MSTKAKTEHTPKFCVVLNTTIGGEVIVEGVARVIKKLDDAGCFTGQTRYKVNIEGDVVERFIEDALAFKTLKQADKAYFAKKAELDSARAAIARAKGE